MTTKLVRVNGTLLRVPSDELTDPLAGFGSGFCEAEEPDWPGLIGSAVCTLPPHSEDVAHIAHDGGRNVIAIWGNPAPGYGDPADECEGAPDALAEK
jgi:hypothetical protein